MDKKGCDNVEHGFGVLGWVFFPPAGGNGREEIKPMETLKI